MKVELDRLDVHPADTIRSTSFEVDDSMPLSTLLREHLAPFVPRLGWSSWTFRARAADGAFSDVALVGAAEGEDRLLVADAPLSDTGVDVFVVGAIPTWELQRDRAPEERDRPSPTETVGDR